jgi:hypothetical protein
MVSAATLIRSKYRRTRMLWQVVTAIGSIAQRLPFPLPPRAARLVHPCHPRNPWLNRPFSAFLRSVVKPTAARNSSSASGWLTTRLELVAKVLDGRLHGQANHFALGSIPRAPVNDHVPLRMDCLRQAHVKSGSLCCNALGSQRLGALRHPVATHSPRRRSQRLLFPAPKPPVAARPPEGSHGLKPMEPVQPTPPRRVATPIPIVSAPSFFARFFILHSAFFIRPNAVITTFITHEFNRGPWTSAVQGPK